MVPSLENVVCVKVLTTRMRQLSSPLSWHLYEAKHCCDEKETKDVMLFRHALVFWLDIGPFAYNKL